MEISTCSIGSSKTEVRQHVIIHNDDELMEFIDKLHDGYYKKDIFLLVDNIDDLFSRLKEIYVYLEAAGGIVQNETGHFLIIKRWHIWDLPKGKIEKGEAVSDAAIREVVEETGINSVIIDKELPGTFHIYNRKGKWFLKKTHWYHMTSLGSDDLVPQLEEDITEAVWMAKSEAYDSIANSYRSIYDTLGFVFDS